MKGYYFAPFYDPFINPFLKKLRKKILDVVTELEPERIMDVCCGTGYQIKLLNRYGFSAVGIDLSGEMLAVAKRGMWKAPCFKQDATAIDYPDESFDMVLITMALHEKDSVARQKIITEMDRILQPDGHLLIADYWLSSGTPWFAGKIIRFIERLAGGEHYRNFRNFQNSGGLKGIFSDVRYTHIRDYFFGNGTIILRIYQKKAYRSNTTLPPTMV